jgi:CxxC-x17-CxxC domain-containing protein
MGEAKRRRAATIAALAEQVGGDLGLAEHMYDQQVAPQRLVKRLREQGHDDIDVTLVTTNPDRDGFEVSCFDCGRKAKMPFEPPAGKVVLCPNCQRKNNL